MSESGFSLEVEELKYQSKENKEIALLLEASSKCVLSLSIT